MDKIRELERIQYELSEKNGPGDNHPSREAFKASNKINESSKNVCVQALFLRHFLHEAKKWPLCPE